MDYLAEIKKLPSEIQDILISNFGAEVNRQIIDQFNLSKEQASQFIDIVNDVYLKNLDIQNIQEEISKQLQLNPKKSLDLATEITGKKLLLADDYFNGKASDYLQGLGLNLTKYAPIVAQELNAIEKERELIEEAQESSSFNDVLEEVEQDEDFVEQSKKDTLGLFEEDLGKLLSLGSEYNDIVSDYNSDLKNYLNNEDFARELEKIILNNNDVITRIKPIVNDESKKATIANWLKDFILFHGSDDFNTIVLAEYLVNSPSAKRLSANDKKKIKRLLNIYRNVSFFKNVLANSKGDMDIIPLENEATKSVETDMDDGEKHEENLDIVAKEESREEAEQDKKGGNNKEDVNTSSSESEKAEEDEIKEKSEKPSLLNELEIMLQDYAPDSLEYKTILQEIKRLKSKQK